VESDSDFEPLLDVVEAAKLLRIHPKTLRMKARCGIIPEFGLADCGGFALQHSIVGSRKSKAKKVSRPRDKNDLFCGGLSVPFKQGRNFV